MATKPGLGSVPSGLAGAGVDSNLSLGVDTSGVDAAKPALDSFVASTDAAARAADRLTKSTVSQSKALSDSAGLNAVAAPITDGYRRGLEAANEATTSFGNSSARARSEVIVLLHELSQDRVRQFGGSMLVMAEYVAAGQLAFSAMNVAVGLLALPLAALVYGLISGANAQKHFTDSLLLTNNAAGQTNDSMRDLQVELSKTTGVTLTTARSILDGLVATGRVGPELIKPLGETIARVSRISTESADQIQKDFIKLIDSPTKWALESDRAYNSVNVKIFEHIRFLEEHGQKDKAVLEAATALSDHFANKQAPAVGYLTDRMNFLKQEMSGVYDYLQSIGRDTTFGAKIDELSIKLNRFQALRDKGDKFNSSIPGSSGAINALGVELTLQERTALLYAQAGEKRRAFYEAESAAVQREGKEAAERNRVLDDRIKGSDRLGRALEKLSQDEAAEVKAHVDAGEKNYQIDKKVHDARVAQLERDNIPQRVRGQVTTEDLVKVDVDKIKQEFKTVSDSYKDVGAVFAAENAAGLVGAKERFEQLKALDIAEAASAIEGLEKQDAVYKRFNDSHKGSIVDSKAVSDNSKQIVKNEQEIQRIRDRLVSQLAVIDVQSKAYFDHLEVGYVDAIQKSAELLRITEHQYAINLENQNLSARQISEKTGVDQINERARAAKQAAEDQKTLLELAGQFHSKEQADYQERIALANEFQQQALRDWTEYYKALIVAENDWSNGAKRALQTYIDNAGFTAKNTEQLFNRSFSSMEDALTSFVTTGKVNFKSLITSFIADLARLSVQKDILLPLAKYLAGALFGGGVDGAGGIGLQEGPSPLSITGSAAIGGPVGRNSLTQVDENGPELLSFNDKTVLMMGDSSGKVAPNGSWGSPINNYFNIAPGVTRNELAALIPTLTQHIETQIIARQRRPGYSGA